MMIPIYQQQVPHAIVPITKIQIHNLSPPQIGWLGNKQTMNSYKFRCHKHQSRAARQITK